MFSNLGSSIINKLRVGWQTRLLIAIFVLQAIVIALIGTFGGFRVIAQSWRENRSQAVMPIQDWKNLANRDPKPGSDLPQITYIDDEGHHGVIGESGKSGGLFFIASCTECVAPELERWNEIHKTHPKTDFYVIPAVQDVDIIQNFKKKHHISLRFVVEDNNTLSEACNPYFMPRIYLFNEKGQFVFIQSPAVSTQETLNQVGKMRVIGRTMQRGE